MAYLKMYMIYFHTAPIHYSGAEYYSCKQFPGFQ